MDIKNETKKLPPLFARAFFRADSANKEARTVELTWTTGAKVLRGFWEQYFEELSMDPAHIRMDRLNKGAPLLNSHNQASLEDVFGVVERAWLEGEEGKAVVRFSERPEVEPFYNDVVTGVIRNVSVGYRVYKYEKVEDAKVAGVAVDGVDIPTYRAIDWEPFEISLVPVPADADATVRANESNDQNSVVLVCRAGEAQKHQEEITMADKESTKPAGEPNLEQIRAEGAKAERERVLEIRKAVKAAKLEESFGDELVNDGVSLDKARALIIDKLADQDDATEVRSANPSVTMVRDEGETFRQAVGEAIAHRAAPAKNKLTELGRNYGGYTLRELARICAERRGVKTGGMGPMQIVERSLHTSSDFPYILENVMNKGLRQAYEESPKTFQPWARQSSAADFKPISRVQLGNFPSMTQVNEAGEFKHYTINEGKESYQLATYGSIVAISRQAIINDDLSAFDRIPGQVGVAAAALESDIVYGILTANAALGDSVALFHATHANLTGTGTVISVASLGVGRALMRKQKGMAQGSAAGRVLNLRPQFLIVPAALETIAQQFTSRAYVPEQSSNINPFDSALQVIVEPRLDDASATAWYLAAAPSMIDTVEYCYLEGSQGVYTETEMGFDVDGVRIKARHDFAAKALDYRGLYKNVGA